VAECLDHLASANRVYLHAMKEPAIHAREQSRFRRGPATLGFVERWFVRTMEPPVKAPFRMKAPRIVEPRAAPPLVNAFATFRTSQDEVRAFPPRVRQPGSSRGPIPEPFCTRNPLQPGHWPARHHRSREAPHVAGLARASGSGGRGVAREMSEIGVVHLNRVQM
jgi:hypothetical protein